MTVRRDRVVPVAPTYEEPPRGIHRCQSCGVGLAKWPRQPICSYCKGDPDYGKDGYFRDIINDHIDNVLIPAGKLRQLPDGTKVKKQQQAAARLAWFDYLSNRRVWGASDADII